MIVTRAFNNVRLEYLLSNARCFILHTAVFGPHVCLKCVPHGRFWVLSCPTCSLLGSQVFLSLGCRSCVLGGFGGSVADRAGSAC